LNGERKLATLHYYATHPMSFMETAWFRATSPASRASVAPAMTACRISTSPAGGNVTAGKYNDGNTANRAILTERIHVAMMESEAQAQRAGWN
jgi:hypothetical protein